MSIKLINTIITSVLLFVPWQLSHAALINYNISGSVTTVQDDPNNLLSANFTAGDLVNISYTVNDALNTDSDPDATLGRYAAVTAISVSIGSSSWSGSTAEVRIFNNRSASFDAYAVVNESPQTLMTGATFGNLEFETFFLQLFDSTQSLFASDALVTNVPPISSFDSEINGVRLGNPNDTSDFGVLRFTVNSIQVPEPASLALLLIGVAGLGCVRRRQ